MKDRLTIGRRAECDVQLKFANVSGQHCRMTLEYGYWFIRDLNSRNGLKVDGRSAIRKRLDPGCKVTIAKHEYTIEYDPQSLGAYGPPPGDDDYMEDMIKSSLLSRAGLQKRASDDKVKSKRKSLD